MENMINSAIKVRPSKKRWSWLLLAGLCLAAGCAAGEVYQPPPYPGYGYPGYYHPGYYLNYYGPTYPYEDPEYWEMWQDRQGGGG